MATISSYEGNDTLEQALQTARSLLKTFATAEGFLDKLTQSFGNSFALDLVGSLVEGWAAGDFGTLPKLEIRSAAEINGANGAFASSNNTVYLSREFLSQNAGNPGAVTNVLLEEIGHYLDSHLNTIDASGDEGAIFSALVQGQSLTLQQLQLLRGEDDSATVGLDGYTVAVEQAQPYAGTNIRSVIDGMDGFLTNLDTAINNQIFANSSLPLVGDQLKNTQQIIKNFQDDIKAKLQEAIGTSNGTVTQVREALLRALGPSGFNFLKDANGNGIVNLGDITVTETANNVLFGLQFGQTAKALNPATPIKFSTGLPGLKLDVTGNVTPKLGFDFNLNFGVNSSGFYVDTAAADELKLNLDVTTPGLDPKGRLGPLVLDVDDDSSNPTRFNGSFGVNLKGGTANRLTTFSALDLDAILDASAKINLKTQTTFNASEILPKLNSDLNINWGFNNSAADIGRYTSTNFGLAPTVAFNKVSLDLGSFFNKFAKPVLDRINTVTKPIQPIAEVLTTPIDLGLGDDKTFNLLKIAKVFSDTVGSGDVAFLEDVARITELIKAANDLAARGGVINLGSFNLGSEPVRDASFDLSAATLNPTAAANLASAESFTDQVKGFRGLKFPILDNQQVAFKLLLGNYQDQNGKPFDLLNYDMPELSFDAEYSQFFPIIGPLGAEIKGEVGAKINLGFGFDTQGLGDFLGSTGPNKPRYDGFFVNDFNDAGVDRPEVTLNAGLLAFAAVNGGIASAGVGGGIFGNVGFNLNAPSPDGKIRYNQLEGLLSNPLCLFDTSGELTAGLRAYVKAGFGPFSYTENFDSPRVTLLNFDLPANCPEGKGTPILATNTTGGLRLNTGPNALGQLGVSPGGSSGGGGKPEPGSQVITQWTRQSSDFGVTGVDVDSFGNVYVTGVPFSEDETTAFTAKYDPNGNRLWSRQLSSSAERNDSYDIAVDNSGNAFITGFTSGVLGPEGSAGGNDAWVGKYDTSGKRLWVHQLGTAREDISNGVAVDDFGNIYITGSTDGSLGPEGNPGIDQPSSVDWSDGWVAKYDSSGNRLWTHQLGTAKGDDSNDVAVDNSGNVYITGFTAGSLGQEGGDYDAWVAKYDSSGSRLWVHQLGSSDDLDEAEGVAVDNSGNVYITGDTGGSLGPEGSAGSDDAWVARYDTGGNRLWVHQFGSSDFDTVEDLSVDNSGNVYITGNTSGSLGPEGSAGSFDGWVAKYDSSGNQLWTKQYGSSEFDVLEAVATDSSNNIYAGGELFSDGWVAKLSQPATSLNLATQAFSLQAATDSASLASNVSASAHASAVDPGNTINQALDLGPLTGVYTFNSSVNSTNTADYYRFEVKAREQQPLDSEPPGKVSFGLLLDDLDANADVELLDSSGNTVLKFSTLEGTQQESIDTVLEAGFYYVRVFPHQSANTKYKLTLAVTNQDEFFTISNKAGTNSVVVSRDQFGGAAAIDRSIYGQSTTGPVITQEFSAGSTIIADGGEGDDTFDVAPSILTRVELKGGRGHDLLKGGSGNDLLEGDNGNDLLNSRVGSDTLRGGTGDDLFEGGENADELDGGSGSDTASYVTSALGVSINLTTGVAKGNLSTNTHADGDTLTLIENITGSKEADILIGNTVGNILSGQGDNDSISGGSGNDLLSGGAGIDRLTGGVGDDAFVFEFKTEGRDTLTDFLIADDTIQVLKAGFGGGLTAGKVITAAQFRIGAAAVDVSDRFIYNKNTGALLFDVDGSNKTAPVQFAQLSTGLAMTNADIFVVGDQGEINLPLIDFNDDGQTDILYRNRTTGQNAVWLMNGTNLNRVSSITPLANLDWNVGGASDFNGDDQTDILWRNRATGQNVVWLMGETDLDQAVSIMPLANLDWSIGGTGDFNGDDQTDILWRNGATGQNSVWLMDGTNLDQAVSIMPLANLDWSIGGAGDFNGDDQTDILWRNGATGENSVWLMRGTTLNTAILTDLPLPNSTGR